MTKSLWYQQLGFAHNPFSSKPAAFSDTLFGHDTVINSVNNKINDSSVVFLHGEYGTGKTSILKGVINEFGGRRRVIYYNAHQKHEHIDYDDLLIGAGGFFSRLFRIRQKDMILLLDEAQDMNKRDQRTVLSLYDEGFFKAVVLVSRKNDVDFIPELKKKVAKTSFTFGNITKKDAISLVRQRIGDLDSVTDDMICKIFLKNRNPRAFLKNMEEVFKLAFSQGDRSILDKHVKLVK